jgi:hypothetical protein
VKKKKELRIPYSQPVAMLESAALHGDVIDKSPIQALQISDHELFAVSFDDGMTP